MSPQVFHGEGFNIWLANELSETKGVVIATHEHTLALSKRVCEIERRHDREDEMARVAAKSKRDKRWDLAKSLLLLILTAAAGFLSACILRSL